MSDHGLTPEELKQHFSTEIIKATTFKTHGVNEQAALDYLETPEGEKLLGSIKEVDPTAAYDTITSRALDQLTSGRDLPRMEVINEPLVKIVPAGDSLHPKTPYFTKLSEFEDSLANGHSLNDRFGLPIKNEAPVYDVYRIDPKGPTEVFVSEVVPTSELNGQVRHFGGSRQYLVPNRDLFTEGTRIASLGNDLALHNELVVSKGLGAPIAAAEASAARQGLRGTAAAKGLGAAGAVITVYDAADTLRDASRCMREGNATAAQARIERFAT